MSEQIAEREAGHWWVDSPPQDHDPMSAVRDFEARVAEATKKLRGEHRKDEHG